MIVDNLRAGYFLLGCSVLLYSFVPLCLALSNSDASPLSVGAGFILGSATSLHFIRKTMLGSSTMIPPGYKSIIRDCWISVHRKQLLVALSFISVAGLSYLFFSWSTKYVDVAISASLFEVWPLVTILLFQYLDRYDRRNSVGGAQRSVQPATYLLMLLAVPAVSLVILSAESNNHNPDRNVLVFGILLALVAPILGSMYVFSFFFTDKIMDSRIHNMNYSETLEQYGEDMKLSVNVATAVIGRVATLPLAVMLAILEQSGSLSEMLLPLSGGFITSLLIHSPADTLLRKAHMKTSKREVLCLQYLSPVLAITWLSMFLGTNINNWLLFIVGTVSIVALNIVLAAK